MGRNSKIARGSTVARRALGRYFWQLRERAGYRVPEAAELLELSIATIYRYESGVTGVKARDAKAMVDLYEASPAVAGVILQLVVEAKKDAGWWVPHSTAIPDNFTLYLGLEELAGRIRWCESSVVPGILQTPEYARVLGKPELEPERLEDWIRVRMARQQRLRRPLTPLELDIVVHECALRRKMGDWTVTANQLSHLLDVVAELSNVTLRVLPFDADPYPGWGASNFEILDCMVAQGSRPAEPTTVFLESYLGALYYDGAAHKGEVEKYEETFDFIKAAALDVVESRAFIIELEEGMRK